ncbi:nucleotide exchange factor GrpE [Agaribacterium haliotis]|uniref:nucleotide exchange factor GrpE n=1 Tax=Agaribacterium haliotis TaxID=2013869 RepID=UPI000BB543DD|nr:nucleotide exchange factor GrpE [Agaribacterium haliotis]
MSDDDQKNDAVEESVEAATEEQTTEQEPGEAPEGDLNKRVFELEEQLAAAQENALRAAAEAQNIRRRAEQDVEKAHKFGLEKLVNSLLPVVDNLERALEAAAAEGADPESLNQGVQLTLKTFIDALQGHKIDQVAPEGEPFDPNLHQAISAIESPEAEPNTVLNVVQKGYTLNGRLVRPAMVVVSKAG